MSKPSNINQDISFVAKMQLRSQADLQFKIKLRIKQPKVKYVLLKKKLFRWNVICDV